MSFFNQIWNPKKANVIFLNYTGASLEIKALKASGKTNAEVLSFDSLPALIKKFGKESPYIIHVSGTGILTRLVDNIPNYKEQLIVNGDKDDFYFTSYASGSKILTSFFRKSLIEDVIGQIKESNAFLIHVSSGVVPCLLMLEGADGSLSYDYELSIENQEITHFKKAGEGQLTSHVNHNFISLEDCVSQGIMKNYKAPNENFSGGFSQEDQKDYFRKYIDYVKFRFTGISVVFTILFLLMGNYFYLNKLNQDVADLEVELTLNNENLALLDRLEQEKTRKEQLILSSGINSKAFISFYIDALGKSVPASISLTELFVFPLKERLKEKRKVDINQEGIEINGITRSSSVLDDWMEKINRFEWVERVELLNYTKINDSQATFKLIVNISK